MPATCLEHSVREAAAAFVRQIGSLSHEPEVRDILLKTAVHEVARQLLDDSVITTDWPNSLRS